MTIAFQELLRLINNGDPVDSGTINTILRQLEGNDRYLLALLSDAFSSQAVYARGVTLDSTTVVGTPVYYSSTAKTFTPALASAYVGADGHLVTAESSQAWGVVSSKVNSTKGDVLLTGYAAIDITGVTSSAAADAGLYYLSGSDAGKITLQAPPVSIPILQSDGEGNVYINPNFSDIFQDHKHYRFNLEALPAGYHSPPVTGGRHVITSPDSSIEGWLPASDAIFGGKAPAGAVFGYNISASKLDNIWPPLPLSSAYLEWNRGEVEYLLGMGIPEGTGELVVIDTNGIWWMSDCYGDVPWPTTLELTASSSSSSYPSSALPECPRDLNMLLTLWFTKMTFQTSGTVVTSLQASADSKDILQITCIHDGSESKTGDLLLTLNLDFVQEGIDQPGHVVVKELAGNKLLRGPVVESIKSASSSLIVASTAYDTTAEVHQGNVTLTLLTSVVGNELPIELVRLSGVTEENYEDILGLGFPKNRNSEYRGKFVIPSAIDGATVVKVALRFWFLSRVAGDLPSMSLSYRNVSRPTTALSLPTVDTSLVLDMSPAVGIGLDEYIEIDSPVFASAPGDEVFFTLGRAGDGGDGYDGEFHVILQRALISEVT